MLYLDPLQKEKKETHWVFFFGRIYLFILFYLDGGEGKEGEREGEREGEKPQCVVASHAPPSGDLAHNEPVTFWFTGWCSVQ